PPGSNAREAPSRSRAPGLLGQVERIAVPLLAGARPRMAGGPRQECKIRLALNYFAVKGMLSARRAFGVSETIRVSAPRLELSPHVLVPSGGTPPPSRSAARRRLE